MRATMIISLVLTCSLGIAAVPTGAQIYAKLAPSDPIVHLSSGEGSDRIYFSKADTVGLPIKITATDATGRVNSLPAIDVHVGDPIPVDKNVFSVEVSVKTSRYVEPGAPYESAILLFDKNSAAIPTAIRFKIEDDSIVSFDVPQTNIVVAVADSTNAHQRVRIRNTGKAMITVLEVTSSVLNDAVNAHRIQMTQCEKRTQLMPGQPTDLDFDLPQPVWAGSYTGTILITANHSVDKSIAVTIQSRGPLSSRHFPLIVFILVVVAGFAISSVLDSWFGSGGLARAQLYLSLKNSETELTNQISNLNSWQLKVPTNNPPISVPRANLWIAQTLHDVQAQWNSFNESSIEDLTTSAQNYALLTSASDFLWSCIETATAKWTTQPQVLATVVSALDAVQLPLSAMDLIRYRNELTNSLVSAVQGASKQAAFVPSASNSEMSSPTLKSIRSKIRAMTELYQVIVWCVVFVTAYQSFYAGHLLFGTLSDYMAVFLWSLGLTSTGTQIVSRVHKP